MFFSTVFASPKSLLLILPLYSLLSMFNNLVVLAAQNCGREFGNGRYVLAESGSNTCKGCGSAIFEFTECQRAAAFTSEMAIGRRSLKVFFSSVDLSVIQNRTNISYIILL